MLENHPNIIKGRAVVADDWSVLRLDEGQTAADVAVPEGKVIVPLTVWQAQRESLSGRAQLGVWFASDERPETLKGLTDFSEVYQTSVDIKSPLYRRQERDVRVESSDVGFGI